MKPAGAAAAAVAALVVFVPVFAHLAGVWASDPVSDYVAHLGWADAFARTGRVENPHFLFHLLTAFLHRLVPIVSIHTAGSLIVPVAAAALLGFVAMLALA